MKPILFYLLQMLITSGLLYGYYHFVLRNKKFHRYNRFYLLASTVMSITIPFLNIPVYFSESETNSSVVLQTLTNFSISGNNVVMDIPVAETSWFTLENVMLVFYVLIASFVLLRILLSLFKIRSILKNNVVEKLDRIYFINTTEPGTPFSFFRWLFWNKKIELESEKGEQIFRHELFHINQKHSWDIMYLELLTVLFWINPFFHLMKKETKAIHEFLADQFAVRENSKWEYAELLLMQILNTQQHLVNPFFHNQIKRRIAMLTTSKKTSHQYLRKLMVFPVAAIVIGLFAFSYNEKENENPEAKLKSIQSVTDTTRPLPADNKIYDKVDIEASYPGDNANWNKYLKKYLSIPNSAKINAPDGFYTTVIQFIVDKDGFISKITPLTNHGYGLEEEAIKVIKSVDKWNPAIKNGKIVKAYKKLPVTFKIGKGDNNTNTTNIVGYPNEVVVTIPSGVKKSDKIFTQVEVPPSFPGGDTAWRRYLEKNANGSVPTDSGAPAGRYTVMLQFLVREDGSITDIRPQTNHGYGMEKEVIRLISKGPKWVPGKQNGHIVNAYVKQPVTFEVTEEDDKKPTQKLDDVKNQIPKISLTELKKSTPLQLLKLPEGTNLVSYMLTIDLPNDNIAEIQNSGNKFNTVSINHINNTTAGRMFTLDQIIINEKGQQKRIPAKVYFITN